MSAQTALCATDWKYITTAQSLFGNVEEIVLQDDLVDVERKSLSRLEEGVSQIQVKDSLTGIHPNTLIICRLSVNRFVPNYVILVLFSLAVMVVVLTCAGR